MSDATTGIYPSRLARLRGRPALLARVGRRRIELALATVLYLGFACYLTWPLVAHLSDSLYSVHGGPGDPYGTMAFYRTIVDHHYDPFLPGTISQFGAPGGIPIPWPRDVASAPGTLALWSLTAAFGVVPAYGLYTLVGYTLTGGVTFLFARRLTANSWAALIAGWTLAFYPFAVINGQGHLDFVQEWLLVLAVWRMLELMWQPSRRNGLLAGLAVTLCMWWSPYFILFGGVLYLVVTVTALLLAWRGGDLRAILVPQLIAAVIVCAFLGGLAALSTAGELEGIGARTHTTRELAFYAARPLEYLVPDVQSPLFGHDTRSFLSAYPLGGRGIEKTLYLGDTVIVLALVALIALARRRLTPRLGKAVLVLVMIAGVALLTSMPPEARILGVDVPFPAHFIAEITSTWRVYSRFVLVAMLAFALLAAVGLDALARSRRPWVRIGVMSLATIAIPLDLWVPQHGHVSKITTPGIYKTLARLPGGVVAEYPMAPAGGNSYSDIFFQSAYNKPLTGGYPQGSFLERLALSLSELSNPATAPRLATLGVRYVVLDATPSKWPPWPAAGKPGRGFRLVAREPYADLYLVTAHATSPALAAAGAGFTETVTSSSGPINWLEQSHGTIDLLGRCAPCTGVLDLALTSYAQSREVTIRAEDGKILTRGVVGSAARVQIPLRFAGHASIGVAATPEPQPVSGAEGGLSVGVGVSGLEFIGARRRARVSTKQPKTPDEAR